MHHNPLPAGIIGSTSATLGIVASWLSQLESWLRLLALILGCSVSALSLFLLIRKGGKKSDGGASMPAWTMLLAIVLCAISLLACSPDRRAASETVRASDGQIYLLVKKAPKQVPGLVSEADLWQPVGETGFGRPVFTRRLQAASDTSEPIMIKAGVLE